MVRKAKTTHLFQGAALSEVIRQKMDETGTGPVEFAHIIGHSPSYTSSLLSGGRPWEGTDRETKKKIAKFIGYPLISVMMLAGIVEAEDFLYEDSIDASLERVYTAIKADPVWGRFCNNRDEWNASALSQKILIAMLYERAKEVEFLKKAGPIKIVEENKRGALKKPAIKAGGRRTRIS